MGLLRFSVRVCVEREECSFLFCRYILLIERIGRTRRAAGGFCDDFHCFSSMDLLSTGILGAGSGPDWGVE